MKNIALEGSNLAGKVVGDSVDLKVVLRIIFYLKNNFLKWEYSKLYPC